ncbi:MAG: hypothetical protein JSS56_00550 [Proteobacteria bacterium]|nr:hypothetical protein [Pseudomonadota bacterium]
MLPHLEIRRIGRDYYTYSVRAGRTDAGRCEDPIDSLERLLNDAGDSLGHYFPSVSVSLDGQDLGSYSVRSLQQNSVGLAAELLVKARPGRVAS